jgi:hypothetical protein
VGGSLSPPGKPPPRPGGGGAGGGLLARLGAEWRGGLGKKNWLPEGERGDHEVPWAACVALRAATATGCALLRPAPCVGLPTRARATSDDRAP